MSKILVIEDNEAARENISDILRLEGFEPLVATNGQQGLELAFQHTPDLIICDVMMPKLNGYEVLEALGKDERLSTIPFIFLTAKAARYDVRQGMTLGSSDYLTKPFSPSELVATIKTQLKRKETITQSYAQQINHLQRSIDQSSHTDELTQLPNQAALSQTLEQYLTQDKDFSLFIISVDQFSFLSSTLSTADTEELIKLIAQRIQKVFPHSMASESLKDTFRMGQNQFSVLTDQVDPEGGQLPRTAYRFLNLLRAPYILNGKAVNVTTSIGIASTTNVTDASRQVSRVESLLQGAKTALYKVQQKGGNDYCFYRPEMIFSAFERLDVENALYYALQQDELEVFYQPQVDISAGSVVGVEALLRWKSAQLGWVSPTKFIPIAEEIGLINDISNWVLWQACEQVKKWQKLMVKPIGVSVNLSAVQLSQPGLCETVSKILQKTAIAPHLLCLEITENALIKNKGYAINILQELKKMGIRIAIDDFGTGYSGLGYLSSFPCNTIKLDRMFIQDIHQRYSNQRIVSAIINMSHELELKVIAEGAETQDELDYLKLQGCDIVQGFVHSRPMPSSDVTKFIQATTSESLDSNPAAISTNVTS